MLGPDSKLGSSEGKVSDFCWCAFLPFSALAESFVGETDARSVKFASKHIFGAISTGHDLLFPIKWERGSVPKNGNGDQYRKMGMGISTEKCMGRSVAVVHCELTANYCVLLRRNIFPLIFGRILSSLCISFFSVPISQRTQYLESILYNLAPSCFFVAVQNNRKTQRASI